MCVFVCYVLCEWVCCVVLVMCCVCALRCVLSLFCMNVVLRNVCVCSERIPNSILCFLKPGIENQLSGMNFESTSSIPASIPDIL